MTPAWEEALWAELDGMSELDQIVKAAEWITSITQEILPALGKYRRRKIVELLAQDDWDATKIAESIGTRRGTINRLADEGRAILRQER